MATSNPSELRKTVVPNIGDIYVCRRDATARQWRVSGFLAKGNHTYAVLCDIDNPDHLTIAAFVELGTIGRFERIRCC